MCVNRLWVILNLLAKKSLGFHRSNSASACPVTTELQINAFNCSSCCPVQGTEFSEKPKRYQECAHALGRAPSPPQTGRLQLWFDKGTSKRFHPHSQVPTTRPIPSLFFSARMSSKASNMLGRLCAFEPHPTPLFFLHLVSILLS